MEDDVTTYAPNPLHHLENAGTSGLYCSRCQEPCTAALPCSCDRVTAERPAGVRPKGEQTVEPQAEVRFVSDSDSGTAEERHGR